MSFFAASLKVPRPHLSIELELTAPEGSVLALIGPNGAGKSTVVETLAGLMPLESGRVAVGQECWEDTSTRIRLPPQRRSVGVMFQALSLFPRMSVLDNVAYGLRSLGASKAQSRARARGVLERLGADGLANSRSDRLSGGQAQKVALARALATEPDLLLLDEPTSKLDVETKVEIRRALREQLADFPGVAVIVTHQPIEAMALSEQLIVMEEGRITQRGSAGQLRVRPTSKYVAEFAGTNLFEGVSDGARVAMPNGASVVVSEAPRGEVFVAIDPNAVALYRSPPEGTPRNLWRLFVEEVDEEGERARVRLSGELTLVAEITTAAAAELSLSQGAPVWASTKATQIHVYPR